MAAVSEMWPFWSVFRMESMVRVSISAERLPESWASEFTCPESSTAAPNQSGRQEYQSEYYQQLFFSFHIGSLELTVSRIHDRIEH